MFFYKQQAELEQDREDLIGILKMRFGRIPPLMIEAVYDLDDMEMIERLILVAANAPTLRIFIEEFKEDNQSFKIVGEQFNPIEKLITTGERDEK